MAHQLVDIEEALTEEYIGDGVYVSRNGSDIKIRTHREDGDHYIYMDSITLDKFLEQLKEWGFIDG